MNVVGGILAGGYGKRLQPLTNNFPKALIEIKENYTILDKQLNDLRYSEIKEVYLMVGHLYEKIMERFGNEWKNLKLKYLIEDKPMGTHFAIKNALENTNSDMVIMNGDVIHDFNLKKFIEFSNKRKEHIIIAVTKMQSPYGIVSIEDGKITSFLEKPILPHYINAGVYYLKREALDYFKHEYYFNDIERTVFPKAASEGNIACYMEDVFWHSIDSIKDLEYVREYYKNREDKPWGYEKIIVNNEKYLVKELFIKAEYKTSIHYHVEKDETINTIKGFGFVEFYDESLNLIGKEKLVQGNPVRIKPKTIHSLVAEENLLLEEYSTPHPFDVIRVKDFYIR
jgi:NDP-sugar pyrophosphorylase family protein